MKKSKKSNVITLTRAECEAKANHDAGHLLGCSFAEARRQLRRGQLDGTLAEVVISQWDWLLS